MRRTLYRLTDSETPLGNAVLVALVAGVLFSWFGCSQDVSGLEVAGRTPVPVPDAITDGRASVPDAAPVLAVDADVQVLPDAAPLVDTAPAPLDTAPPRSDAVVSRICDDVTNPCPVCQACRRGVCTPSTEHEACGPVSCDGTSIVGRVCHNGDCAALAVVKDCATAGACRFDDSGRPYVEPGVCMKMAGGAVCAPDRAAFRYCDRTCGQADGGIWECRSR